MELRDALAQISEIRLRMARVEVYRGLRAGPAAFSGFVALLAAGVQAAVIPVPQADIAAYVALWVGAAAASALTAGLAMVVHYRRARATLDRQGAWLAVEQLLPCIVAGALLTFVLFRFAPETAWLLPALWQILFGLGLFASSRLLPRPIAFVGGFYLVTGLLCVVLARGEHAFSPLAMGVPFGAGQLLAAAVLYWCLERGDGQA